jgi:hypothetical protein
MIADCAGSVANITMHKCAVIPQTASAMQTGKSRPFRCASQRRLYDWLLRNYVSAISHCYLVGFFMPLDATMPDNVPVKNTTIVDIKSMKAASLGACFSGCEIKSNPYVMPITMVQKTIASSTPTVTIMRACSSSAVYLCRVMVLCRIGQARCSYLTSCF